MVEKFVWGGGGFEVATASNLNASYLELLWVELSWDELKLGFENLRKFLAQNLEFSNKVDPTLHAVGFL